MHISVMSLMTYAATYVRRPQGLVDAAQRQLAANYMRLQQLCAAAGAPPPDDASFRSFQSSVGEWSSMLHHHSAAGTSHLWGLVTLCVSEPAYA